jgi:FtsH-binding integral membrane protein
MKEPFVSVKPLSVTEQNALLRSVYNWMMIGLFVSGALAFWVTTNERAMELLFGNSWAMFVLIIVELGLVVRLTRSLDKITASNAAVMFLTFSAVNGLTLSSVFLIYTMSSIFSTFLVTGLTFGVTSLFGYSTKRDLTSMGHYLFMALIGLIIAVVVNLFMQSSTFDLLISGAGVIIFVGLTAWDTQKIKRMGEQVDRTAGEAFGKIAIVGALALYLDFINLFLMLLRFMGDRR